MNYWNRYRISVTKVDPDIATLLLNSRILFAPKVVRIIAAYLVSI